MTPAPASLCAGMAARTRASLRRRSIAWPAGRNTRIALVGPSTPLAPLLDRVAGGAQRCRGHSPTLLINANLSGTSPVTALK
jgi:hypothetical protein